MSHFNRRCFLCAAVGSAFLTLMQPSTLLADASPAEGLPPWKTDPAGSLMSALQYRKSTRSFSTEHLPPQILSDLLWAACGVNRPGSGKRTAPSARNRQEMDIFVATGQGCFRYDAPAHGLVQVSAEDIRPACGLQGFVAQAPVNLVYVADFSRMGDMGEEEKRLYSAADCGFISQNVYLFCAISGLATVVRGSIDRPLLARKINLGDDQRIILAQTVGFPG